MHSAAHFLCIMQHILQGNALCGSVHISAEVSHLILEQVKHPERALHNSAVKDTGLHNSAVRDTELHNYSTMRDTGLHNSLLYAAQCSAVRDTELHN